MATRLLRYATWRAPLPTRLHRFAPRPRSLSSIALLLSIILSAFFTSRRASAQVGPGAAPYPSSPYPAPVWPTPGAVSSGTFAPGPHAPLVIRYEPGSVAPPGYHYDESPRKGLIVAGALTFGIPYLISLTIGGASRHEADRWLMLPVVGPIGTLTYGMRGCDRDDPALDCTGNILIVVGLAFDLAAQMAGATLFTMGYVFPKKQWVSDAYATNRSSPSFAWTVVPRADRANGIGLAFTGTLF
ncbi:MAG: hypothetical protein ABW133_02745 [Polyangiaceae bacterium]